MKIAITGTPGTGKTEVAKELERRGYEVLYLNSIVDDFVIGYDEKRNSKIVDENKMNDYIKEIKENGLLFIEGHLSHLMDVDAVFVLRCHPDKLISRLEKREWKKEKIMENAEAEALDIILDRTLQKHKMVWEIDTTDEKADKIADRIIEIIEKKEKPNYGKIDYSEWLIENVK